MGERSSRDEEKEREEEGTNGKEVSSRIVPSRLLLHLSIHRRVVGVSANVWERKKDKKSERVSYAPSPPEKR